MMFKTQFDSHDRIYQNPGSPEHILYGPEFSPNGVLQLKEIGVENIYDYIQSHADSVDINVILARFAQGDTTALSKIQGAYGDFTQFPKTFAEALNTMIAAEQYFMTLPVDVRAQFNHNFNEFIASMDAPDFLSKAGIAPDVAGVAATDQPVPAPAASSVDQPAVSADSPT